MGSPDNARLRERLGKAFEQRGLLVLQAPHHDAALAHAKQQPIDRAVVDLRMPGLSGLDVVRELRMLTDPAWLLRVGLYLELITCLGIFEAVRPTIDLLSPEERALFETGPRFAELRRCIDAAAWTKVWGLRGIAFMRTPGVDLPVGVQNLLKKKAATLAFLHAHHDDLRHAIALAGPNRLNAQETWQRVFRDAERDVLLSTFTLGHKAKEGAPKGNPVFVPLARRMAQVPALIVRLFVNLRRKDYQAHASERDIEDAFVGWFRREVWPWDPVPQIYYDPRSLGAEGVEPSFLHAKCVVVDDARAFVTSANLTEAAHGRNIEAGVLLEDPVFARSLRKQFESLIDRRHVRRLTRGLDP